MLRLCVFTEQQGGQQYSAIGVQVPGRSRARSATAAVHPRLRIDVGQTFELTLHNFPIRAAGIASRTRLLACRFVTTTLPSHASTVRSRDYACTASAIRLLAVERCMLLIPRNTGLFVAGETHFSPLFPNYATLQAQRDAPSVKHVDLPRNRTEK